MGFNIVGVLVDLVLRGCDCLADATDLEVKIGETILKQT